MYWYFIKINESPTSIIYDFGYESKEIIGRFQYNKVDKKTTFIDNPTNFNNSHFDYTVLQLIETYGAPDKRVIAYG